MPRIDATYFNTSEYQLQGKNHFEVKFKDNGRFTGNESGNTNNAAAGKTWSEEMTLLVKSFPLPKEQTEVNTLDHFNQQIKLAGKTTFQGGELVIHDAIDKDVEILFRRWRNAVYNASQGTVGYASEYKIDGIVTEYKPNGGGGRKWHLVGCWPSDVNYGDLDYETGGYKDISATIVYDWAFREDSADAANTQ